MRYRFVLFLGLMLALTACGTTGGEGEPQLTDSTFMRLADKAYQNGDVTLAAAMYQKAIAENGKLVAAHLGYGKAMMDLGQTGEAEEAYKTALQLKPGDVTAQRSLASILIAREEPERAAKLLTDALNQKPDSKLFNALGIANDLMGKSKAAQQAYYAGLVLQRGDLTLQNNLGLSLGFAGKTKDAIAVLQKVVSSPVSTARHRQNLALVYVLAGQKDLAEKLLRMDSTPEDITKSLDFYARIAKMSDSADKMQALMKGPRG